MEELTILDAIERYIRGEMTPGERVQFEELRKSNPGIDQMVVEHTIFINELHQYGERKQMQHQLNEVREALLESGEIKEVQPVKLVTLWKKYKRVVGVAASIAGLTALSISILISYLSPRSMKRK